MVFRTFAIQTTPPAQTHRDPGRRSKSDPGPLRFALYLRLAWKGPRNCLSRGDSRECMRRAVILGKPRFGSCRALESSSAKNFVDRGDAYRANSANLLHLPNHVIYEMSQPEY